jgi:hypothetical protein
LSNCEQVTFKTREQGLRNAMPATKVNDNGVPSRFSKYDTAFLIVSLTAVNTLVGRVERFYQKKVCGKNSLLLLM